MLTDVKSCCSRTYPQSKWALIGTAIRIARSLGLHRENSMSNRSLFQREMNRRLWWHLRVLDFATSMELNCFESSDSFLDTDTNFPLNINDSDLDPTQDILPLEHQGATEMSFSILRFDICAKILVSLNKYRFCNAIAIPESLEQIVQDLSQHLDQQYFQLFERDLATPVSRLCSAICLHIPTKLRMLLHRLEKPPLHINSALLPVPSAGEIEGSFFLSSICLLDFHIRFPDDEDYEGWSWLFGLSKHWRMIEFILQQLDSRLHNLDDLSTAQYWDSSGKQLFLLAWKAVETAFASMSRPKELHDIWRKLDCRKDDVERRLLTANLHS
jgi:hypothetical protein